VGREEWEMELRDYVESVDYFGQYGCLNTALSIHRHGTSSHSCLFFNFFHQYLTVLSVQIFHLFVQIYCYFIFFSSFANGLIFLIF
jgi:hypothetical protein